MFRRDLKVNFDELTENIDTYAKENENYLLDQSKEETAVVNEVPEVELDSISMIKINPTDEEKEIKERVEKEKNVDYGMGGSLNFAVSTESESDKVTENTTVKSKEETEQSIKVIKEIAEKGTSVAEQPDQVALEMMKMSIQRKRKRSLLVALSSTFAGLLVISGLGFAYYMNQDTFSGYYASILGPKVDLKSIEETNKQLSQSKTELENKVKTLESQLSTNVNVAGSNLSGVNLDELYKESKKLKDAKTELEAKIQRLEQELSSKNGSGSVDKKQYDELVNKNKTLEEVKVQLESKIKQLEVVSTGSVSTGVSVEMESKVKALEEENNKLKEQLSGSQNVLNKDNLVNVETKDFYDIYKKDVDYLKANIEYSSLKSSLIKINLLLLSWDKKEISYDVFRKDYNSTINSALSLKK